MNNLFCIVLAAFVTASQAAPQAILRVSPGAQKCMANLNPDIFNARAFLRETLDQITAGKPTVAEVGLIDEVEGVFRRAGTLPHLAKTMRGALMDMTAAHADQPGVLGHIGRRVMDSYATSEHVPLLICVPIGKCRIKEPYPPALHVSAIQAFGIQPFAGESASASFLRFKEYELQTTIPQAIVVNPPAFADPFWLSELLKSLSHFGNMALLGEWLAASIQMQARGEPAEELFRRYVRFRKGQAVVDEGFVRTFMAGQDYQVSRQPLPQHLLRSAASRALAMLPHFGTVTAAVVADWHITSANIFAITDQWRESMLATIQREL